MTGRARGRGAWVLLLALASPATAQDLPDAVDETFAVSSLPPLLALGADAVVRLELLDFEVHDPGRATERVRRVVTVLRPEGREQGQLVVYYGRLRRLKTLTGRVFDAKGGVVRRLEKEDQEDASAISGYTLYEEERVRVARLYHDTYPYTVEYAYELQHDGLINWPTWYPQEEGMPVVFARFDLTTAPGVDARYVVQGAPLEPTIVSDERQTTLRWEVKEEPALMIEPFGPAWQDQVVAVRTAPVRFAIEGTQGDMRSWQSFGRWYHRLNDGRAALPADAQRDVLLLTTGVSSPREKARRLYTYMQERTRYVSVQLGLGGWQTFDAAYVHERGYGDCKALTNYMHALLTEAGIPSFPALVSAGRRAPRVIPDFPSNQFNHVILYVDLGDGEGVWLENTDQTVPFGHLGTFTEDRYALLVTPDGGELVHTPASRAHLNRRVLRARVSLDPSGGAAAEIRLHHTGNELDAIRQRLVARSAREREEWLYAHFDIPSFEIVSSDVAESEGRVPSLVLSAGLDLPHYAALTGRRLFLPVSLLHRWTYVPPPAEQRTHIVNFFPYAFTHADTIRYELPDGFAVEAVPDPVAVETTFLRYAARIEQEPEGILAYYRWVEVTDVDIPADSYDSFRDAMRRIAQADRAQIVIVER